MLSISKKRWIFLNWPKRALESKAKIWSSIFARLGLELGFLAEQKRLKCFFIPSTLS